MAIINVRAYEDVLVLHFGTEGNQINAYTLATTLANFADAARAANAEINPGYEIEVVVEALSEGSFKATLRTVYRNASNLFSEETANRIIIGLITAFIAQSLFTKNPNVHVEVLSDEVIIQSGDDRVVVPRRVHDTMQQVAENNIFVNSIGSAIRCVAEDEEISTFGFSPYPEDDSPELPIPRDRLLPLYLEEKPTKPASREIVETADLKILRAILERSKRRWQFVWDGIKISAPVLDGRFHDSFFSRDITIAPGDSLHVKLRITQVLNSDLGIYMNEEYEVVQVLRHIPREDNSHRQSNVFNN